MPRAQINFLKTAAYAIREFYKRLNLLHSGGNIEALSYGVMYGPYTYWSPTGTTPERRCAGR